MIFQRGNPMDYDKWTHPRHGDVSYEHCLPYFKRMETCLALAPRPRRTRALSFAATMAARMDNPAGAAV